MKALRWLGAVAGITLLLTACGAGGSASSGGEDCSPTPAASGTVVQIVKLVSDPNSVGAYDPKSVTIASGQLVQWDWQDNGAPHSVTADDSTFESCLQNAGHSFRVAFPKPGAYAYHCSIHPGMKGTVVVQ